MKKIILAFVGSLFASILFFGCGGGEEKAMTEEQAASEADKTAASMNSDAEKAAAQAEAKAKEMAKKAEAEARKAMEDLKTK
ncbi:MAG: hypothetical protein O3C43_15000 [Verrucomicrobia bacterium]|nr:hypothetical protein [Verrucomicrobiota bacterium]MDA1067798.1 hypothetical protein [Verrucomicrobiota bacterium]